MTTMTDYRRDHTTAKAAPGVRLSPKHWAGTVVHAFRQWTGERALVTWCGIGVDLEESGVQTAELINCLQCSQASWVHCRS